MVIYTQTEGKEWKFNATKSNFMDEINEVALCYYFLHIDGDNGSFTLPQQTMQMPKIEA